MSYSWTVGSNRAGESSRSQSQLFGSAAVETPLTPPNVRNVSPSTCLSMIQFRGECIALVMRLSGKAD